MPCDDVTEVLTLNFSEIDCLQSYELKKLTCGRAVGEASLLQQWAIGQRAEELACANVEQFLDAHRLQDEAEEYLFLKHFFALKLGSSVYLGHEPGTLNDPCTIASLSYGPEGTEFSAELKVELLTDEIKSCGRCGKGCGAARAKNAPPAAIAQ